MTKKIWMLLSFAAVLAVAYVIFFTSWFRSGNLQIYHTLRTPRSRLQTAQTPPALLFVLNRSVGLTRLKVVPLDQFQTNQSVLPLWHMVSDSNSIPIKSFMYGQPIRGMKPMVAGSHAQPLASNIVYRLIVEAGSMTGHNDFKLE